VVLAADQFIAARVVFMSATRAAVERRTAWVPKKAVGAADQFSALLELRRLCQFRSQLRYSTTLRRRKGDPQTPSLRGSVREVCQRRRRKMLSG
jgi:hypothetical protein